jgi:hypothetical protein
MLWRAQADKLSAQRVEKIPLSDHVSEKLMCADLVEGGAERV